jgi:HD-like signal output (HDOD) protein
MNCCSQGTAVSVAALAAAITEGRTSEEIAFLAAVFVQLGDTMATIAAADEMCAVKGTHKCS